MGKKSPGRPRKYGEPLIRFQAYLPESLFKWFWNLKEELDVSFSELFMFIKKLIEGQIDKLELLAKVKHLEDYVKQLEKRVLQLEKEKERLEEENRRLKLMLKARNKDELYIFEKVNELFSKAEEFKLAVFLRRLGFKETGDDLKRRAEEFIEKYFSDEGKSLVSEELGLVITKDSDKILAWKVRRLDADSFRERIGEVVVHG